MSKNICKSLDLKYIHVRLSIPYSMRDNESFYFTKIIKSISRGERPEIITYTAQMIIFMPQILLEQ